ncbi:MAG: hypothetical protein A3D31_06500 [Candidatus Fluviicola riflensis]|nr:MAG: hypothetical protein CHH17_08510 [Candidatus Fluviicola riflensis]OGS79612.1 MAG: hypothetical protein A3D31_06500 [Candidatus Fluviicola riflensis]OGS87043.1 MAG: hypothetical protein A2724_05960 [Fluviicola sp. RIFCSPHIGHO2_01_FULL_43_53]OGS89835.1 MAG: hypothetical protein A3E30_02710 [Fluviicola sp. RIFCSPHIGHO2_12_FULL_43_24]
MFAEVLNESNDNVTVAFNTTELEKIYKTLADQFQRDGYRMVSESGDTVTYERGTLTGRIFLGAFYKHFKWDVSVVEKSGRVVVSINKQVSGMWGGLIGVSQVKNELWRLKNLMVNWN